MALIATGFAVQAVLRMRGEETAGHLESLLATALARPRWAAGHLTVALAGSALVVGACGAGTGLADAFASDDAGRLPLLTASALAMVPAVWVLAGVAVALFGLAPRGLGLAWVALGGCFLVSFFGPLLSLPDRVMDISPFSHVALMPAADFAIGPPLALTAIAAALVAVGLLGFRARNVPG
jgi:ABC-2 type transport system permease protein